MKSTILFSIYLFACVRYIIDWALMEEESSSSVLGIVRDTSGFDNRNKDIIRVVVQNLQKQKHLASNLIQQYQPDILLAQEINLSSEPKWFQESSVHFTSRNGYGTAIYLHGTTNPDHKSSLTNIQHVESPHAEVGGFIRKKTILATQKVTIQSNVTKSIQWISFHGYNGQPLQTKVSYLVDHVRAVLMKLDNSTISIFAGDFNTWTQDHVVAVTSALKEAGFRHERSWRYPGRDVPLDHVFLKGDDVAIKDLTVFQSKSDHLGALLTLSVDGN
jgi:exonuclease III